MTSQMPQSLNQIIITRPLEQADSLIEQLESATASSLSINHLPLLEIQPVDFSLPEMSDISGMIFISSNAVKFFYEKSKFLQNSKSTLYLAVGNNTAEQLEQITQNSVIFPQQMNAEGLLKLTELQSIKGQHWLIIKGNGGRQLIRQTLLERGAKVSEIDVYMRKLPNYLIQQSIIDKQKEQPVWLITSAEALTNLYRILGLSKKAKHQTKIIISSARLAILAKQKGFLIIAQSEGAAELQLVQCVKMLIKQKQIDL